MPVVAVMWDAVPRICLSRTSNQDTYISNRPNAITCAYNAHDAKPCFTADLPLFMMETHPNHALWTSIMSHHAKIAGQKRGWLDEDQQNLLSSCQFGHQTENRTESIANCQQSSRKIPQWSRGIFTCRHTNSPINGGIAGQGWMPRPSKILNPTRIDQKVTEFGRACLQTFFECWFLA